MTRQEFINDVTWFGELKDFCYENDCDVCEDVIDSETMDEWIWDEIRDWGGSWEDLSDALGGISQGYDWYRRDGSLDYVYLDQRDFDAYKSDVLAWADDWGNIFDGEEDPDSYGDDNHFFDPVTGDVFDAGMPIEAKPVSELDAFLDL